MLTTERITSRLFGLQSKLETIGSYHTQSGDILFKYAIEFEVLLSALLRTHEHAFDVISHNYTRAARRYCELGCELCDEHNRKQAFIAGKSELNLYIRVCLKLLTQQHPQSTSA